MSVNSFKPADFVHLHNHTHYSLLDGLQKVPEMLDRVVELGMEAVAITDHGTLSGVIEFYKEAKKRDVKPIIGIETYVAPRKHTDKEGRKDASPYHLILLAMNNQGYENLMRLSTVAHLDGFYYKPRIDRELLEKYSAGIIVLSGCIGGEVGEALRNDRDTEAEETAKWYQSVFGDRYYLELQDHGHEWSEQARVNDKLLKLGSRLGIELVVTADAHYCLPEDQAAHEVLLCVQTASQLSDTSRMSLKDMHLYVTEPEQVAVRWSDNLAVLTNTRAIADRCEVEIELGGILIPRFDTPEGESEKDYLAKLAYQGLVWRYSERTIKEAAQLTIEEIKQLLEPDIIERFEYELGVINSMGFAGYFLIVSDFIQWGKSEGIIFGPGRGSAAGSIVSYALNITDLDPLKYDLLFERFLNPDRISMPDIDIDIQDTRRNEVIDYTIAKYGADRVANIVTFGTMAARNAIRDTARVLGVPYGDADRLAKMIPPPVQGRHIPLKRSLVDVDELKAEYAGNPQSKKVFDLAVRLEGTIRSHGVHAAGVVIAPDEIVKYTPLEMAQKGVVSTQYPMNPIEELGLLKMDFLGLSNLTIIKNALRIIRKVHEVEIDISSIPMDDTKTFELFSRGDTTGVFQLESAGMKRYLKQLGPNQFEDIIAMVALYRPGPMAELPRYIEGKNKPDKVTYPHKSLEPILEDTYGVMVYQEQIIAMLQLIAGYTAGEADLVRKAIGKKKREIMEAEEPKFIQGCIKQGLSEEQANGLWALIQPFADYSFNKSHAACYALIAYQTAYLKAHYPSAFMAALMTSDFDDADRIAIEIAECRHMGIDVLPPDVNESFVEFAVRPHEDNSGRRAIRFGLSAVKNVGIGAVEEILRAREEGKFNSVEDFAKRVSVRSVNRKAWESLIKAGAFDTLGDRAIFLLNLDKIVAFAQRLQKDAANGQTDLFGDSVVDTSLQPRLDLDTPQEKLNEREYLQWERELLGVYLSSHPLDGFSDYLAEKAMPIERITKDKDGNNVQIGGLVTAVREITTRNGAQMAFVKMEDKSGELEIIVFPKTYEGSHGLWEVDKVLLVQGKVNTKDRDGKRGEEIKIMADKVREINERERQNGDAKPALSPSAEPEPPAPSVAVEQLDNDDSEPTEAPSVSTGATSIEINLPVAGGRDQATLQAIKRILDRYSGEGSAFIAVAGQRIKLPFAVQVCDELIRAIEGLELVDSVSSI
ncbi:MAG: DNA polymerase III subunit alpha [Candidatus Saccharimonadales bacterium]